MDKLFKISVIIPVYNVSRYIERCLVSVEKQTLREIEVIMIDDHGSDDSISLAQAFVARSKRQDIVYRFIETPQNSGPAFARNLGIKEAQGEYVAFLDADDWIEPEMYETLYANAKAEDADLRHTAVMDSAFAQYAISKTAIDPSANVELVAHNPKRLEYLTHNAVDKTLVFSEIYYPYGWKATIDGKAADLFRVNYMLRAINVPAGEHRIVMVFDPDSVRKGDAIAVTCIIILFLTILGSLGCLIYKKKHE